MSVRLAPLVLDQLPALLEVERASQPLPWTEAQLAEELSHADAVVTGAFVDGALAGYAAWRASVDELWLLNLAVLPSHRRRGLGRLLLNEGERLAEERGLTSVWLEVREGNAGARALYEGAGFLVVGRRRGYYRPLHEGAAREDAVLMTRSRS